MQLNFKTYPISEEIEHANCTFYTSLEQNAVKIPGKFTYQHNNGIFIDLMEPIDFIDNMALYAECEFGYYTFYNTRRRAPNLVNDRYFNTLFDADYMLSSRKFPSDNLFKRISFSLVNLSAWFPKVDYKTKKKLPSRTITVPNTSTLTFDISNSSITFKSEIMEKSVYNKLEFDLISSIIIESLLGKEFNVLLEIVYKYRTFFQLLSDSYSAFTEISIFDNNGERYRVYFVDLNSEKSLKWDTHHAPFIDFKTIKEYLPSVIKNWDRLYEEIRQVIDILIMEFNNYYLSPEVRFLNIARAIETFHRKLRKDYKLTYVKEMDKWMQKVKNIGAPKRHIKRIYNCFSFIKSPTLRERVNALCKELNPATLVELDLQDGWETKFTKSRNYYTHFGDFDKDVLKGEELRDLSNQVRKLLYVLVAKELGIKEITISDKLYRLTLI